MPMRELDEIPIDPDEANDLKLHVRNCMARHAALVKMMTHDKVLTWLYRIVMFPTMAAVAYKVLLP